jgi:phage tail sheath protein FI
MPIQISPGVNVSEIDLTTIVPAVGTSAGGIAGLFNWGPIGQLLLLSSETDLVNNYGPPTNNNAETWFSAANFLSYGSALYVSRAGNVTNTTSSAVGNWTAVANVSSAYTTNAVFNVTNSDDYAIKSGNAAFTSLTDIRWIAKYPGALGNSLQVSVCDNAVEYSSNLVAITGTGFVIGSNVATINAAGATSADAATAWTALTVGDYIVVGNSTVGTQYLQISSKGSSPSTNQFTLSFYNTYNLSTAVNIADPAGTTLQRFWQHYDSVPGAPGQSSYVGQFGNTAANDELHVVVVDDKGLFTGVPGQILEVWSGLSRATDAQNSDGSADYFKTVINQSSKYIWLANPPSGYSNTAALIASTSSSVPETLSFVRGNDGASESMIASFSDIGTLTTAWDVFNSTENVDVSLLIGGKSTGPAAQLSNYIINNIANVRKDCVVFISPQSSDVVQVPGQELSKVTTFRNAVVPSSYAVMDSGYKYQYDKYNDVYRYIPLNGDTAGLCVYTDNVRDPWWSPAGFTRGQIKNVVKLAYNPKKADRDVLYSAGVNPIVTFPGQGTILYGDKTLSAKPSAFDRINVRRLFIVLEKSIAIAAQSSLFEFNDEFTRSQFVQLVTPFLKDVQGRRGIYDFKVVCDGTNNTPAVIDSNRFVGDIYIKPARSINFIQLNFVAVRSGVEFSEIVGKF